MPEENKKEEKKEVFSLQVKPEENNQSEKSAFSFLKNLMNKEKGGKDKTEITAGNGAQGAQGENVFTKLFKTQPAEIAKSKPVVGQSAGQSVFGPKPLFFKAQPFEKIVEQKKIRNAKILFFIIFISAAVSLGYLFLQLNSDITIFGKTIKQQFQESNDAIIALQTKINEMRFRNGLMHLMRLNFLADTLLFHPKSADNAKADEMRENMKILLDEVKKIFSVPLAVPIYSSTPRDESALEEQFKTALKDALQAKKQTLNLNDPKNEDELRTLDNLIQLTENKSLRNFIRTANFDVEDNEKLNNFLKRIRELGSDDLSLISQLKQARIKWIEIINEIENRTRMVDKIYGQGLYEEIGGIQYNSYNLNANDSSVTLNGSVKTDDSKTFSFISDLIDTLERSSMFKNVEMRSYGKSRAEKGGFSGNIELKLKLQSGSDPADENIITTTPK